MINHLDIKIGTRIRFKSGSQNVSDTNKYYEVIYTNADKTAILVSMENGFKVTDGIVMHYRGSALGDAYKKLYEDNVGYYMVYDYHYPDDRIEDITNDSICDDTDRGGLKYL
jgi:hypothetical protein